MLYLGGGGEAVPVPVDAGQGAGWNHVGVSTMERLDLGPSVKHPETDMSGPGYEIWPPALGGHSTKELSRQPTYLTILICYNSLITIDGVVVVLVPQCLCCPWVGEVRQFLSQWAQGRRHPSIKHPETDISRPGFELHLPATKELSRQLTHLIILTATTALLL